MANFPKGDSFFRLLKETAPSPVPSVEKKPEPNHQFKLKTSLFHQRIAPTEQQKQSILKDILDNNINHIYNTEILPQERREAQKREQMEFEIEILDKPSSSVLYKPPVTVQPRRAPSPMKEAPEYQKLWPIKFENGRQPSTGNPLRKSSEDDSDDDDKFEDRDVYKEVRVREYKMSDLKPSFVLREKQKTQDRVKEENMEKLKNELKAMNAAAKKKEEDNREEIRRKADESARQNAEKIRQYKLKMKESEQNRMESLLKSNGQMITDRFGNVNQSIIKQRKNTDPLIKFLLSHKYYQQKMPIQQTIPIPDEFDSYISYQQTFQPLMMNEYISNIQKNIESLLKDRSDSKCIKCTMRLHNKKEEEGDDDYTIVELQESKDQDQTDNIISYQHKNASEVFNLSFANNYLILISFSKEFSLDQVNREDYRNGVPIVGFINTMDKSNIRETPKAKIMVNYNDFRRALKKEWITCYVRPIDKITTFLREYISLNCFAYSDVNQYVFRPRIASNIIAPENNVFYKKFFGNIKAKYNEGQLAAIQDVCLSKNGICLLQGPPGTGKTHTLVGIVSGLYHYLKSSKTTHRRYIMICTPSNTAVDEIILRIKQNGLYGENGETIHPNIVRIGVLDRDPHELVKQCALENLAHKEILKLKSKDKSPFAKEATLTELKDEIAKITKRIQSIKQGSAADKKVLDELHEKRRVLYDQLYDYKAVKVGEKEKHDQITQSILYSADIICCTLNSAGSEKLERFRDYIEAIIVDEAGQATEPSNIIPLQYSPKKLILIGDPKQLPAVTFANDTQITKFNRSLFERILDCGVNAFFLYEQYRMVSSIRRFPSMHFYQDRLTDALSVQQRKFPAYLSQLQNRNVIFLDLPFSRESMIDHSYYNTSELNTCVAVLEFLMSKINTGAYGRKHAIGCISPYKKQVLLLNDRLREKYGNEYRDSITANTVDAFQGQEKDVIIFSTVRANSLAGTKGQDRNVIGFLNDVRRMNVAITRPKFVLVIVGNSTTLATDETWRSYIDHLIQQQCYVNVPAAHQIDKVVQNVLSNEQLASYLTSPPDLPIITPKKIKRDPRSESSFFEGIRTPKQAASTFPRHDLEQVQAVSLFPSFQRLTSGYEDNREKENKYEDGKRLWNNKDSHTSEYFTDAVFSQIEDLEKIEKKRKLNEKNREVKIHQESSSAEKTTTGKSSVLSALLGEKSATNSAKKSSSGGSGLSSLFARTPDKKESEDQGPSILKSLFNF